MNIYKLVLIILLDWVTDSFEERNNSLIKMNF